ncbi:MAG: response regulator [Clostridiales Family XIII bacterium]|nr:response regulator [Clostridiales Family XIII bacterium]
MPGNRAPKNKSITARIRTITLLITSILAVGLIFVMTFFMNFLTDTILLETLQPMAKTAAQGIEGNLHTLAERFFLLRDQAAISSPGSTTDEKRQILDEIASGVEFTWVGLYFPDGARITGTDEAPNGISGREIFSAIKETENLVIEDTSIGFRGEEITMGLPVTLEEGVAPAYYLVGGYDYEMIGDILRKLNVSPNGMALIVNEEGKLIAHKDMDKVFRGESVANSLGTGAGAEEVFLAITQGQTGTMETTGAQGRLFVSFSPIRGTQWSLVIIAPRSDYIAATNQALTIAMIVTIAFLVCFSLFLTFFIRKTLSLPLKTITGNADKLAQGEFESLVYPNVLERRDEIGQLGAAFLSVSRSVQSLVGDIAHLTGGAREGKLGERSDVAMYMGDYRNILSGINATLDAFCSHLDIMPDAVMFLDASRRCLYHNRAMRELLERHGLDETDIRLLDALMPLYAAGGLPPEAGALFLPHGEGESFQTDVGLIEADGGEMRHYGLSLWRVNGDAASLETGKDVSGCVMLILNDITQLTNAKTDAEAANRSKGEFLARMSHEMRTPMNAIIGMSSIAKSSDDAERKEYCLTRIGEASGHLLGIINDILDMSKIEAAKFELSCAETDFEQMLRQAADNINFRVQEKGQNLFVNIGKGIPAHIIADGQRLRQVIANLLGNAVKFTPDGGAITLLAEKTAESADACTLLVEVRDTGIGISEEQQKRLFTAFEQADGSFSRRFGGTGLGLAISRWIIELMGGRVWVESELGKGSSFFFEFEAAKSKPCAEVQGDGTEGDSEPASIDGIFAGKTILIAEDVDINREIIAALLEPTAVSIDFAFDGQEAVGKFAASDAYALILMDIHMPNMDGFEATQRIRASERPGAAAIPIVAMTANVFREDVEKCLAAGMNDHLGKPLEMDKVINTLSRYLG